MSKQPPPAPTASAVSPCPTLIQIRLVRINLNSDSISSWSIFKASISLRVVKIVAVQIIIKSIEPSEMGIICRLMCSLNCKNEETRHFEKKMTSFHKSTVFLAESLLSNEITVGQRPTALAVGAGGGCFGHFYSHLSFLSSFSLSLGDGPI